MNIERAWYEGSPYLYASVATITILCSRGSVLMNASGWILLAAALTVLGLRWIYRRDVVRGEGVVIDEKRYAALVTQDLFHEASPSRGRGRRA